MRAVELALGSIGLLVLAAGVAQAQLPGRMSLTWGNQCSPIVADVAPRPGETATVTVFVDDHQIPLTAYRVHVILGHWDGTLPDAWRFDAEGCQGSASAIVRGVPPPALVNTCPAFGGTAQSLGVSGITVFPFVWRGPDRLLLRAFLGSSFDREVRPDPARRYFLAQFQFDHSASIDGVSIPGVSCGGMELGMCLALDFDGFWGGEGSGFTRSPDGVSLGFLSGSNGWLTTNGSTGCPSVPARASTWGGIKSQYRR